MEAPSAQQISCVLWAILSYRYFDGKPIAAFPSDLPTGRRTAFTDNTPNSPIENPGCCRKTRLRACFCQIVS